MDLCFLHQGVERPLQYHYHKEDLNKLVSISSLKCQNNYPRPQSPPVNVWSPRRSMALASPIIRHRSRMLIFLRLIGSFQVKSPGKGCFKVMDLIDFFCTVRYGGLGNENAVLRSYNKYFRRYRVFKSWLFAQNLLAGILHGDRKPVISEKLLGRLQCFWYCCKEEGQQKWKIAFIQVYSH